MYTPDIYKNQNKAEIESFLKENSFGIMVNNTNGRLCGTHIPLEYRETEDKIILEGHISLVNPQGQSLQNNNEVLCIFNGPHTYISPSWYDHENVPTWNYVAVHVYGLIKILTFDQTISTLERLIDKYEKVSEKPIALADLSAKTMREAKGIIGFEIHITEIQATKKMSQNRDQKNYNNIIAALEKTNITQNIEVASVMKKCPR